MKNHRRNQWGKSAPAVANLLIMYLPGGLRRCKSLSWALVREPPQAGKPPHHLSNGGEGEGLSSVLWPRNSLLDLRNVSLGRFSWTWLVSTKILHSDKRQSHPKISMGLKWRRFLASQNDRGENNLIFSMAGGKKCLRVPNECGSTRPLLTHHESTQQA